MKTYKKLKFVELRELGFWDTKRYLNISDKKFKNNITLSDVLIPYKKKISKREMIEKKYAIISKINFGGELFLRDLNDIENYKGDIYLVPDNSIIYSKINVKHGCIFYNDKGNTPFGVSSEYPIFTFDNTIVSGKFLQKLLRTQEFKKLLDTKATGISKARVKQADFLATRVPLPPLSEQETIVKNYYDKIEQAVAWEQEADALEKKIENYLFEELGVSFQKYELLQIGKLHFIEFKEIENWIYNSIEMQFYKDLSKSKFPINTIGDVFDFISRNWEKKANEDKEYIELGSIDANFGILETKTINPEKAPSRATQIVKTGDLIIGTTRPYLKKFAIIDEKYSDSVASSGFSVIEENKGKYNLYFLNEVIKSDIGIKQFEIKMTGALYPAITQTELESLKIPVPPLSKQNEIAATIATMKQEQKNKIERATLLKQQAEQEFEQTIFS